MTLHIAVVILAMGVINDLHRLLCVYRLIRKLKELCNTDGFLGGPHMLVMMIDTVLLSTSHKGTLRRIALLMIIC